VEGGSGFSVKKSRLDMNANETFVNIKIKMRLLMIRSNAAWGRVLVCDHFINSSARGGKEVKDQQVHTIAVKLMSKWCQNGALNVKRMEIVSMGDPLAQRWCSHNCREGLHTATYFCGMDKANTKPKRRTKPGCLRTEKNEKHKSPQGKF